MKYKQIKKNGVEGFLPQFFFICYKKNGVEDFSKPSMSIFLFA